MKTTFSRCVAILTLLPLFTFGQRWALAEQTKIPIYSNNPILAEVDGRPIRLDDLKDAKMQKVLFQLFQMLTIG